MRILIALLLLTTQASAYVAHGEAITATWTSTNYTITRYETFNEAFLMAQKPGCEAYTDYDTDGGVVICGPKITGPKQIVAPMEQD
jgi:hypothetical protein